MSFFDLHPVLRHHIVSTLGWPGLRPLQEESVGPLRAGEDAILLAPTAGGKTEAATFPLLTRMADENWAGVSVLYVCPLKALLNNLEPRLSSYAAWLGRRAAVWHGDASQSARKKILRDPPDILLTTPESLESMMVSTGVSDRELLGGVQTVVIDEVHAFAGDDRGWHLSAVLARLEHQLGHPVQRVGMSATVGNPDNLLVWLQGGRDRPGRVIAPGVAIPGSATAVSPAGSAEIIVDAVDGVDQAAQLISKLHQGEKRLVFVDSRRIAEELAGGLAEREVTVFLSHSSLSADQRRRSEEAFASARDCVIVATSTLELGIDVGDLDRVIQLGTPQTVSSFLQRLGRTGRRAGTVRNCLFIALDDDHLLNALGMLHAWSQGFVEPVTPPPLPLHLAVQQFLAASLQRGTIPLAGWDEIWAGTPLMNTGTLGRPAADVLEYLLSAGMLEQDGPYAFIGRAAEQEFGRRHFMELLSAFTTSPMFTVFNGTKEIGTVELRTVTTADPDRPLVLKLAGRDWMVTKIDWNRHRIWTEPSKIRGVAKWGFSGPGFGRIVSQGMRQVLLGSNPEGVRLTARAENALESVRSYLGGTVSAGSETVFVDGDPMKWWTWRGSAENAELIAALGPVQGTELAPQDQAIRHDYIRLAAGASPREVHARVTEFFALPEAARPVPDVSDQALAGLKFSAALPDEWGRRVLGVRMARE